MFLWLQMKIFQLLCIILSQIQLDCRLETCRSQLVFEIVC